MERHWEWRPRMGIRGQRVRGAPTHQPAVSAQRRCRRRGTMPLLQRWVATVRTTSLTPIYLRVVDPRDGPPRSAGKEDLPMRRLAILAASFLLLAAAPAA